MKVIVIKAEQFLKELDGPANQELIRRIKQLPDLKEKHAIIIIQSKDHVKGLDDKLQTLKIDHCCTLFTQPWIPSGVSARASYEHGLVQHISLNYGEVSNIQLIEIPPGQFLSPVLQETLAGRVSRGESLNTSDAPVRYKGIERKSHSGPSQAVLDPEGFKGLRLNWRKYRQELAIFCVSLLFAIIMALSVGLSSSMGKAFALAFGVSHLGTAALAVSTGFLMLAFCLALTLLIYAAVYVWRKRNALSCCRVLDRALKDQARATPVSSVQLTTPPAEPSPTSSVASLPATPQQGPLPHSVHSEGAVETLQLT